MIKYETYVLNEPLAIAEMEREGWELVDTRACNGPYSDIEAVKMVKYVLDEEDYYYE